MPVLAPDDDDYAFEGFFCAHQCDYKFSCAAGVGRIQMSSECMSSERDCVVVKGVAVDWAPSLVVALTLFFKMTSEGGTSHQMHHSPIKCCSLPRLMGLRADYAGLYIMSELPAALPARQ